MLTPKKYQRSVCEAVQVESSDEAHLREIVEWIRSKGFEAESHPGNYYHAIVCYSPEMANVFGDEAYAYVSVTDYILIEGGMISSWQDRDFRDVFTEVPSP